MAVVRTNPVAVSYGDVDRSEERIKKLISEINLADESRRDWLANQRKLTQQRLGIKDDKRSGPWPGASDVRIPTQDKAIRRWKPKILSLVFDVNPVAYFRAEEPNDVEAARNVEMFYDWLFKTEMEESIEECCYLADLIAHRGYAFLHLSWDYRTEDESRVLDVAGLFPQGIDQVGDDAIAQVLAGEYELGADEITPELLADIRANDRVTLFYQTVVADRPRVTARDPVQVVAPSRCADVANAPWLCVQHIFDLATLRSWARDERLEATQVERVAAHVEGVAVAQSKGALGAEDAREDEERALDKQEGISDLHEDPYNVEVWEVYAWTEEPERRRVVYWLHPASGVVLAAHPYCLPFHAWPLVKFDHEKTFRRWNAPRGISRMLSPLARTVDRLHNARLDAIAIQLAPVFKWKAPAGAPPRSFRFAPGQIIPVTELSDVEPLAQDLRNIPLYTAEEYQTRQYAEDYAGIYDSSLMSTQNPNERRTATEVNYVAEQMQGSFSLDAKLFQMSMARVHTMVWQLWYEFGRPEVYFRVLNEEQPKLFKKSEVAAKYDIIPVGTPANTNKAIELSRAREAMQFFAVDESGVVDKGELFKWYLGLLDWLLAKRVIRGPQEQQASQILMGAANEVASGNLQQMLGVAMSAQATAAAGGAVPGAPPLS